MSFSDKFIYKYMRLARQIAQDNTACFSRKIGAVIVKETGNSSRILGTGYNGAAPKTPHPDSYIFLKEYFWPQLTVNEKESLILCLGKYRKDHPVVVPDKDWDDLCATWFSTAYANQGICPRRLVKAGPGERSELCSCGHAERRAITNAACDLDGATMFCWCGVPCLQCTDAIIHSGITTVHCLVADTYHSLSPWLFKQANVNVFEHESVKFQ